MSMDAHKKDFKCTPLEINRTKFMTAKYLLSKIEVTYKTLTYKSIVVGCFTALK